MPYRSRVAIDLGDLDRLRVRAARVPHISIISLLKESQGHISRGLPSEVSWRLSRAVDDRYRDALDIFTDPRTTLLPSCLHPEEAYSTSLRESLASLLDAPADSILASIHAEYGDDLPPPYRRHVKRPRGWLADIAYAAGAVATAAMPIWRGSERIMAREERRIDSALAAGQLTTLLPGLHDRLWLEDNQLCFDDPHPEDVALGDRELLLVPMFAGSRMLGLVIDDPRYLIISYGTPGLFRDGPWSNDPLVELLGEIRGPLLLSLMQPTSAGDLAAALQIFPSSVTFHCKRLIAAGLISREQRGTTVYLSRTERGDAVIEAMCA